MGVPLRGTTDHETHSLRRFLPLIQVAEKRSIFIGKAQRNSSRHRDSRLLGAAMTN
jgi:hypothetical protein